MWELIHEKICVSGESPSRLSDHVDRYRTGAGVSDGWSVSLQLHQEELQDAVQQPVWSQKSEQISSTNNNLKNPTESTLQERPHVAEFTIYTKILVTLIHMGGRTEIRVNMRLSCTSDKSFTDLFLVLRKESLQFRYKKTNKLLYNEHFRLRTESADGRIKWLDRSLIKQSI